MTFPDKSRIFSIQWCQFDDQNMILSIFSRISHFCKKSQKTAICPAVQNWHPLSDWSEGSLETISAKKFHSVFLYRSPYQGLFRPRTKLGSLGIAISSHYTNEVHTYLCGRSSLPLESWRYNLLELKEQSWILFNWRKQGVDIISSWFIAFCPYKVSGFN